MESGAHVLGVVVCRTSEAPDCGVALHRDVSFLYVSTLDHGRFACVGACCDTCLFPSARRYACTGCAEGFLHFRCLARLPAAVANVGGQRSLCATCAQAAVQSEAPQSGRAPRGDGMGRVGKGVKRVRPATPVIGPQSTRAAFTATPAGYSRAGTPASLLSLTPDWHTNTGTSSCGASNDPGERAPLTSRRR